MEWFELTGPNPTDPQHYTLASGTPSCVGTDQICAVQADNDGGKPELTEELKDEMIVALHDGDASTNVLLKKS